MPATVDISPLLAEQNRWWGHALHRPARAFPNRRDCFPAILRHLGELTGGRAALLLGPRQVGKTTLLLQVVDELLDRGWPPANVTFFDFSDDRLIDPISPRAVLTAQPAGLRTDRQRAFLFDEIQEALGWQRWLKVAVDEARRMPQGQRPIFIATGSAAGALGHGTVESGQGRWDEISVEGLNYGEFLRLNAFLVDGVPETAEQVSGRDPGAFTRYLLTGGFPEHARPDVGQNALARIRQDVIDRALLRDLRSSGTDIDRVKRLFVYLVVASGAAWEAASRAADLEANRKTVEEWLVLLEGTRLIRRLETDRPPRAKAAAQLRPRKKIYAADHALVTALSSFADPLGDPAVRGRVLEAAVFRHLREIAENQNGQLGYFRRAEDLELDFVFRPPRGEPVAVEVTGTPRPRHKVARLTAAADAAQIGRRILVYDGVIEEVQQNIAKVPAHRFLLEPGRYLEEAQ